MSDKLISAKYLLDMLEECEPMNWNDTDMEVQAVADWRYTIDMIERAPAVDAVEVVRCGECIYRGDEYECPLMAFAEYTEDDEYCSDGRRREENAVD